MNKKILVFGCSGTVGAEFVNLNKNKNVIFFSRKKPEKLSLQNWRHIDLDKRTINLPKKTEKIFFFSSPYYITSNLKKKIFMKEFFWLKKITNNIKCKTFIYLSSSSVYLDNHVIGSVKLKCENYLKKNLNFDYLQIWRPFNLIGNQSLNLSDHFYNILLKKFYIEKKRYHVFFGSKNDERAYSSAENFCKLLIKKSNLKKNFICNYGNSNTIKVNEAAKIFKKIYENKFKRKITYNFISKSKNNNSIKFNKIIKTFNSGENSYKLLQKYYLSKLKICEKYKM